VLLFNHLPIFRGSVFWSLYWGLVSIVPALSPSVKRSIGEVVLKTCVFFTMVFVPLKILPLV
jgi:hypothetical protein